MDRALQQAPHCKERTSGPDTSKKTFPPQRNGHQNSNHLNLHGCSAVAFSPLPREFSTDASQTGRARAPGAASVRIGGFCNVTTFLEVWVEPHCA